MRAVTATLPVVAVIGVGPGAVWAFAKKQAEAVRETRTAQGFAEEARLIAERF